MYKTLNEVQEVISLGKPEAVINIFLESYLQGLNYEAWINTEREQYELYGTQSTFEEYLNGTEEVVVGYTFDSEPIIETRLVREYQPLDMTDSIIKWKIQNYAIMRKPLYPPISDYADAIVKGDDAAIELYKSKCLAVKALYPKEVLL